ncbi:hypothetical protein BDV93DRAFT_604391 [Ceratobasidium sp. AG-I]|nr:hypothetical protein BDV93DRAFT_604391 [Ceratobasidium sp. AG-I]
MSAPVDDELPGYTPAREPHEHLNTQLNRNGKPWMTLRLLSDAPVGSKFPVYFDGGTVRGSAQIDLDSVQTIRSVVVEVKCKLGLASHDDIPIWNERKVLWDSTGGHEPRSIASTGSWKWDFSFPIPDHFDDSAKGGSATAPVPSNFDLKPYPAFAEYRVLLFVRRGKWFSNLSELHTMFAYIVRERAPPPSPLRALAYSEQRPPPGPLADPDGWQSCRAINVKGVIFGNREVDLVCQPYISSPLIYPRGGTIFYRVGVSCSDPQALQLLSSSSAVTVLLTRVAACTPPGMLARVMSSDAPFKGDDRISIEVLAQGVSWTGALPEGNTDNTRVLEGEISIPPKADSNITLALLYLRYSVVFAIDSAGFVPHEQAAAVIGQPIQIVSHPALGVRHAPRMPPGYGQKVAYHEANTKWAHLAAAVVGKNSDPLHTSSFL